MGNSYDGVNLKQARRLLRAITDLAREASMTGSLEKGSRAAIRQYNGLLHHLSETSAVPEELFSELDEHQDSFDELGVACTLLNAYIEDDAAPALAPPNMMVQSDSQELRELRELRDLLRERMPEK